MGGFFFGSRKGGQQTPQEPSPSPVEGIEHTSAGNGESRDESPLREAVDEARQGSLDGFSLAELVDWLLRTFGKEEIEHVKDNPYLTLRFGEGDVSLEEWLEKSLKTIFCYEDLQSLARKFEENVKSLYQTIEGQEREIAGLQAILLMHEEEDAKVQEQLGSLKHVRFKLEKKVNASIPLTELVEAFLGRAGSVTPLLELMEEAIESPSENLAPFVVSFCRGWMSIREVLFEEYSNEDEHLDHVHRGLSLLLAELSGRYIPQRGAILKTVARMASERFSSYEILSPEETRQVDPRIHNAVGIGGSHILEGMSFAAIRKDTRQTVRYADIKVG